MATVRVLVLRAPGINCDEETAFAWESAGAAARTVHVNRLIETPRRLADFQVLTIPGGFSYGDDIASGKILACQLVHHLADELAAFVDHGGFVLGICNGFQVLLRAGLLPGPGCDAAVTLTHNQSGRYEDRWVQVRSEVAHCPFLEKGEVLDLPVAHAEGNVAVGDASALAILKTRNHVAMRYVAADGGKPTYPANPNGSTDHIAALTDDTGRVLGLMPHPERHLFTLQAPDWIADNSIEKRSTRSTGHGHRIFRRAVERLS